MSDTPTTLPEALEALEQMKTHARRWERRSKEAHAELRTLRKEQPENSEPDDDTPHEEKGDDLTSLRDKLAEQHGITPEDAALLLTGTDEETLTRQAEALAGRLPNYGPPTSPREGAVRNSNNYDY